MKLLWAVFLPQIPARSETNPSRPCFFHPTGKDYCLPFDHIFFISCTQIHSFHEGDVPSCPFSTSNDRFRSVAV